MVLSILEYPIMFVVSYRIRVSNLGNAFGLRLRGVMSLLHLVHCEYFSLPQLSLGIGQDWLLVSLAGALREILKLQYFWRTEQLCCFNILFSEFLLYVLTQYWPEEQVSTWNLLSCVLTFRTVRNWQLAVCLSKSVANKRYTK
jgi:hypothetical protein